MSDMFLASSTFAGRVSTGTLALHDGSFYKIPDPGELFSELFALCLKRFEFLVHCVIVRFITDKIIPFYGPDVKGLGLKNCVGNGLIF